MKKIGKGHVHSAWASLKIKMEELDYVRADITNTGFKFLTIASITGYREKEIKENMRPLES